VKESLYRHLSIVFPIPSDLKQGATIAIGLEYGIWKVQENQEGLKPNEAFQSVDRKSKLGPSVVD
jgi:hypothetical protein